MRQTLSRLPEPLRGCPRPTARVLSQKPVPRPPRATREVVEGRRGPAGGGKAWPQNGCWVGIRGAQPPSTPRPRYVVHTGEARPQRQPRRGRRRREARRLGGGGGGAAAACGHGSVGSLNPPPRPTQTHLQVGHAGQEHGPAAEGEGDGRQLHVLGGHCGRAAGRAGGAASAAGARRRRWGGGRGGGRT